MLGKCTRTGLVILLILLVGGGLFAAVQGFLAVEAFDGVQVYVNGEKKGITVGGSCVLMLDPGSYQITLEKEGYSSTRQTMIIKANESTSLKVDMRKPEVKGEAMDAEDKTMVLGQKTGTVEIRSLPFRDADIHINGVNYGKTDRRLRNMPVGQIKVEVTYKGNRLVEEFIVKENSTIQLLANYVKEPAQIIQLFEPKSRTKLMMGTVCSITIYDYPFQNVFDEAFARLSEIESKMSFYNDTSEIAAINNAAGRGPVRVSADTYQVIKKAIEMAIISDGAFDPTIGPLVKAWGIGGNSPRKPSQEEIDSLLPLIDYHKVILDDEKLTVELSDRGMMLDLGGIVKGYAADEVAKVLSEHGIEKAIINFGGSILAMGTRLDGTLWRIGIQNPEAERGKHMLIVGLQDLALDTTGSYERNFELDGEVYHHILDTQTGYPVDTTIASVSISTSKSFIADALSTAVFALGLEKGMELVNSLEGVEAIMIDDLNRVYLSDGFYKGRMEFEISDTQFVVARP